MFFFRLYISKITENLYSHYNKFNSQLVYSILKYMYKLFLVFSFKTNIGLL